MPRVTVGDSDFHYAALIDSETAAGTYAYLSVAAPAVDSGDSHSLAEVAAISPDGREVVEVGWTVDRGVNGDSQPHIFVFHWVNGTPRCYNACGYQQQSPFLYPGIALSPGSGPFRFAIQHFEGNWWLGVGGEWMGFFPGSEWTSPPYTELGVAQWFGEVAAPPGPTCTDMGTGAYGGTSGAATITQPTFIRSDSSTFAAQPTGYQSDPGLYKIDVGSGGFGGPGACAGTSLTDGPRAVTNVARPVFSFSSEDPAARFECAIDRPGSDFAPCSGPGNTWVPSAPLPDGTHVFEVRARDAADHLDPTPARSEFVVDTTPPDLVASGVNRDRVRPTLRTVDALCDESCAIDFSPTVVIRRGGRVAVVGIHGSRHAHLEAGTLISLRMRLDSAQRARLKRAYKAGARLTVVARIVATDDAGNRSRRTVRVALKP